MMRGLPSWAFAPRKHIAWPSGVSTATHGTRRKLLAGLCLLPPVFGSCVSSTPARGYQLYSGDQGPKERAEVAQLSGPITKVDGRKTRGGPYELLPGCHIVEVQPPTQGNDYVFVYSTNKEPIPFAVRMRPGHSYSISSSYVEQMGTVRLLLRGEEHDPSGAPTTEFGPAKSINELRRCVSASEEPP